ncbi:hypothetical protein [Aureimonas leprariae]|uniref:Uncharacterized protein n=1 Tax=Plantimonas leprariae TaxID=2615207 RepID=A0A7V7TUW5_9HYPH|nr:hypothetical protein [Aureimonas leprariae]KAB0676443.1 hypothetical protein F6X38_21360 [Aureimonas leprariae]
MAPDARSSAHDLQDMASADLLLLLGEDRRRATLSFLDWLLRVTPQMLEPPEIIEGICRGLLDLGVPLDRYRTTTAVVTADMDAIAQRFGAVVVPEGDVELACHLTNSFAA